jgi:hypothetical protein
MVMRGGINRIGVTTQADRLKACNLQSSVCSLLLKDSSLLEPKVIGACSTLTVLLRRTILDHLRRSRPAPKNRET